jgi:hypothetical protein
MWLYLLIKNIIDFLAYGSSMQTFPIHVTNALFDHFSWISGGMLYSLIENINSTKTHNLSLFPIFWNQYSTKYSLIYSPFNTTWIESTISSRLMKPVLVNLWLVLTQNICDFQFLTKTDKNFSLCIFK